MKTKNLSLNFRRFTQNKLFITAMLLFAAGTIGYLIFDFYSNIKAGDVIFRFVYPLWQTNRLSIYSFAFFLMLSYEFCSRIHAEKLYETISCTKMRFSYLVFSNVTVLTALNAIYTLLLLVFNVTAFLSVHTFDAPYIFHIIINIFVNIFLVNTFAVLFGQSVSFLRNKIISYILLLGFLIFSSQIGEGLAGTINIISDFKVDAYSVFNIMNIFPPNLNKTPTFAMGFSVLPYRILLLIFWILLSFAVIFHFIKRKKFSGKALVSFLLAASCLALYALPESKIVLNKDLNGEAFCDQNYYAEYFGENKIADFQITKYNLDMKIRKQLYCTAVLTPDTKHNIYEFTLYHGYKVNNVTDQNGVELNYQRERDYLKISGAENAEQLVITYSGSGKSRYSNVQGIYLPGDFPYYPIAGKQPLYEDITSLPVTPENTPEFKIAVSSNLDVYSNLKSNEKNIFYGKTQAPCLYAGFLAVKEYGEMRVVYPYLTGEVSCLEEILSKTDTAAFAGKTIFFDPHVNIFFEHPLRKYDNAVMACNFADLIAGESEVETNDSH